MKASSHEKHAKQQWKTQKKTKSSDPWARSGERPGRGHGSELFFWGVFPLFFAVWPKHREKKKQKTKSSDPWARSGLSTHKPKKQKKQETKKPKNQKTKKPKKTKKTKIAHPKGRGSDAECWVLSFCFFLVFWFFGLCVDSHCRCAKQRLPGTVSGCTRTRSIHYSTAMFAMT